MKRILIFLAVSASMSMTTGCAHKKRVKNLEAELTRCYEQKLQLQSQAEGGEHYAAADCVACVAREAE